MVPKKAVGLGVGTGQSNTIRKEETGDETNTLTEKKVAKVPIQFLKLRKDTGWNGKELRVEASQERAVVYGGVCAQNLTPCLDEDFAYPLYS